MVGYATADQMIGQVLAGINEVNNLVSPTSIATSAQSRTRRRLCKAASSRSVRLVVRPRPQLAANGVDLTPGTGISVFRKVRHIDGHMQIMSVACAAMKPRGATTGAGERIKVLRLDARMTTREVEKLSLEISKSKRNPEYYISHAWLTDIENGEFTPSIYKLYSLSAIYKSRFTELLGYFGLNLNDIGMDQMAVRLPRTHLVPGQLLGAQEEIRVPVQLAVDSSFNDTKILQRSPEAWQKLPLAVLQHLNTKDMLYGYVGFQDFTLYPLIRPGSFVEINPRQNKIRATPWTGEHDRPIYFVDLRDSYACGWCQLDGRQLSIVAHPISRLQVRTYRYPDEAEIVGRVTAVAMRLVDPEEMAVTE
jgi:transcriptional regulator with XRE-family HTH domain